jgi:uroporphyrinogen III methyltransferase/synthase
VRLINGDVEKLDGVDVACIGPVTAAEARGAGLDVAILAGESTVEGLVEAITDYYGGSRPNEQPSDDQA